MILIDVNVLVYAFREDAPDHPSYRRWLNEIVDSEEAFGYLDLVLSGFIRVVTHPRIFRQPTPLDAAFAFADSVRSEPQAVPVAPGARHWQIFRGLCDQSGAKGNLVADAYLAAVAIESGSEWITTDRDFARFPRLRWRHPLAN
jgi:toxin-antitoxin system PIN domain toxin